VLQFQGKHFFLLSRKTLLQTKIFFTIAISKSRSQEKITEGIQNAIKIYGEAVKSLLKSGIDSDQLQPDFSCDYDNALLKWIDGKKLYK
jgi:F0F1-type ATP synthase membrane subunit a